MIKTSVDKGKRKKRKHFNKIICHLSSFVHNSVVIYLNYVLKILTEIMLIGGS